MQKNMKIGLCKKMIFKKIDFIVNIDIGNLHKIEQMDSNCTNIKHIILFNPMVLQLLLLFWMKRLGNIRFKLLGEKSTYRFFFIQTLEQTIIICLFITYYNCNNRFPRNQLIIRIKLNININLYFYQFLIILLIIHTLENKTLIKCLIFKFSIQWFIDLHVYSTYIYTYIRRK